MGQRKGLYYEVLNQKIFDAIVNQDEVKTIDVQHDVTLQGKPSTKLMFIGSS